MAYKPRTVSLFAGVGGLTRGFADKFSIELAVEIDKHAATSFKANFPSTKVIQEDINGVNWDKALKDIGLSIQEIDVIIGGPPCQGFSFGNRQTNTLDNPNNRLWESYLNAVKHLQPKWFIMENVPGLWHSFNGKTKNEILNVFKEELGYHVETCILNAAEFGVPQIRKRAFFAGSRDGLKFVFPKGKLTKDKFVTVREAIIGDLPPLESDNGETLLGSSSATHYQHRPISKFQRTLRSGQAHVSNHITVKSSPEVRKRWQDIPPGGNWADITEENRRGWRNVTEAELKEVSHSNLYKRLDPDKPAITIANFRRSMICHPFETRIISVREAARLQSFPDDHKFIGPKYATQQMVANAVPPLLARAVAQKLYYVMRGWITLEKSNEVQRSFLLEPNAHKHAITPIKSSTV